MRTDNGVLAKFGEATPSENRQYCSGESRRGRAKKKQTTDFRQGLERRDVEKTDNGVSARLGETRCSENRQTKFRRGNA